MAVKGESLESWLNKSTNPSNREEDWQDIMRFCEQVNKEREGPQIAVRLLSHKIQSPQEWEAIQALTVLETCMNNCGKSFHSEVGKFRFLNELIKVMSPKYLGETVSERLKTKVIEMLYKWTVSLPEEAKICEAYRMLKSQGIVSADPKIPLGATLTASPSPRPKNPVFDEKKTKILAELLKSKKPEDLQAANRLIKNMVKEDEVRTQKAKKQKSTLEAVSNSVKLLNEMLAHFSPDDSADGDKEIIKELYGECDKLRQSVSQIASETEDHDSILGDILRASDDLSHVINSFQRIVEGQTINGETDDAQQIQSYTRRTNQSEILIDLIGLDDQSVDQSQQQQQPPHSFVPSAPSVPLSLLDEELPPLVSPTDSSPTATSALNVSGPVLSTPPGSTSSVSTAPAPFATLPAALPQAFGVASSAPSAGLVPPPLVPISPGFYQAPSSSLSLNLQDFMSVDLGSLKNLGITSGSLYGGIRGWSTPSLARGQANGSLLLSPMHPLSQSSPGMGQEVSLTNVFVPLDAIKPSQVCPVTAYDKKGIRLVLHFASDCPAGRPDVLVMVASMLNIAPLPVRELFLQVAVPKMMKVRLQPPSGTALAPFNPILPPPCITQVMLLANPLKEKVRMRYKLIFTLGEQSHTEVGEVNEFPPTDRWGGL